MPKVVGEIKYFKLAADPAKTAPIDGGLIQPASLEVWTSGARVARC